MLINTLFSAFISVIALLLDNFRNISARKNFIEQKLYFKLYFLNTQKFILLNLNATHILSQNLNSQTSATFFITTPYTVCTVNSSQ